MVLFLSSFPSSVLQFSPPSQFTCAVLFRKVSLGPFGITVNDVDFLQGAEILALFRSHEA